MIERDAQCFEIRDIRFVEIGDVRNAHPVAMQVGAGDAFDARQWRTLDRSEFGEVDFWPGQKVEATAASGRCWRDCGRWRGQHGLDVFEYVLAQYTSIATTRL